MIFQLSKIILFVLFHKTIRSYKIYWPPQNNKIEHHLCSSKKHDDALTIHEQLREKESTNSINHSSAQEQCVVIVRENMKFCKSKLRLYLCVNDYFQNKELITISPGGMKGYYFLGILSYIKENYDTDNLIYSGASAGSWNGLFMCYRGNTKDLLTELLQGIVLHTKSLVEMQYYLKFVILSKYKSEDFDLKKLFIGVSKIHGFGLSSHIFTDFQNLEDAINCCMASSHIPFLTGGLTNRYNNMFSFDGGFSDYPYLDMKRKLHISPDMWKHDVAKNTPTQDRMFVRFLKTIKQFSDFFSIKNNNPLQLFDDGYQDAKNHREWLDKIFTHKSSNILSNEDAIGIEI
jgi:hypothetical protein